MKCRYCGKEFDSTGSHHWAYGPVHIQCYHKANIHPIISFFHWLGTLPRYIKTAREWVGM